MTPLSGTVEKVRSGVLHLQFIQGDQQVASGSGFMVAGHLVTNNHVFAGPAGSQVVISHHPDALSSPQQLLALSHAQFSAALVSGSDPANLDFAILKLPQLQSKDLHQFTFGDRSTLRVGDNIAFLGFPLEHANLVCHAGIVSSFYERVPASVIQIDASVNQSNSGGPLIDPDTGNVLGIITRKGTGLSKLFEQLHAVFGQNITALSSAKSVMRIAGVDPVEVAIVSQNQMKALADEILRSANVGIGYAFAATHLKAEVALN